jgi:rubrerythrin
MERDPIVEEIRQYRQKHAAVYDHDIHKIFEDIKRQENKLDRPVVKRHPKRHLKATGS